MKFHATTKIVHTAMAPDARAATLLAVAFLLGWLTTYIGYAAYLPLPIIIARAIYPPQADEFPLPTTPTHNDRHAA